MSELVYLACPYSHPHPAIREERFNAVTKVAAELLSEGHLVFSPITHAHPMAEVGDLPRNWEFWEKFDRAYLQHSYKIIVLQLDGWKTSTGVAAEVAIAKELGLIVEYRPCD